MRTMINIAAALLLAALVAPAALTVRAAPQPLDVDVHVAGHSSAQMDAARYNVQPDEDVTVPEVSLPGLGRVLGTTSTTDQSKRTVFSYLGVPFGEAPVGELRFMPPVTKAWTGVHNGTVPGKVCYQVAQSASARVRRRRDNWPVDPMQESEDCLVLDVHTPKVDPDAKMPVLVFVHGGSFHTGYAGQKPPTALLDEEDIILVSPQYRLGPLGFLNLQVPEVPGNAGLLDLVEALRWVNKNIQYFGGDPSQVTLAGHSAGAASSSVLYLSHLTKGLISGVLPMSGSALGFWAWDRTPEVASQAITGLVQKLHPCQDTSKPIECLKSAPAESVVSAYLLYAATSLMNGHLGMSGSIPSLQKAAPAEATVLLDLPENLLSSPDLVPLPYMTGVTKHEGTFPLELAESYYLKLKGLESNTSFVRNDLVHVLLEVIGNDDPAGFVSDTSLLAYFDPSTLGDYQGMRDGLIDMMGAFGFKSPARRIVERNALLGKPSYLYAFNHNGALSQKSPEGIYHGADQPYIFPLPRYPTLTGADLQVSLALRKYITNFVIYQNPTPADSSVANSPTWKAYERDQEDYLELVWPPAARQWFQNEMLVARRDQFNEGGTGTTAAPSTGSPSNTSTRNSGQTSQPTSDGSAAVAAAPSLALALGLLVAILAARP